MRTIGGWGNFAEVFFSSTCNCLWAPGLTMSWWPAGAAKGIPWPAERTFREVAQPALMPSAFISGIGWRNQQPLKTPKVNVVVMVETVFGRSTTMDATINLRVLSQWVQLSLTDKKGWKFTVLCDTGAWRWDLPPLQPVPEYSLSCSGIWGLFLTETVKACTDGNPFGFIPS